jgi:hypothetical protein
VKKGQSAIHDLRRRNNELLGQVEQAEQKISTHKEEVNVSRSQHLELRQRAQVLSESGHALYQTSAMQIKEIHKLKQDLLAKQIECTQLRTQVEQAEQVEATPVDNSLQPSSDEEVKRVPTKPDRKYCCTKCNKSFATKTGFQGHWNKHLGKVYTCDKCNKTFSSPGAFAQHMEFEINGPVTCTTCAKQFEQKSRLKMHMKSHTAPTYACTVSPRCQKIFTYKCDWEEHEEYFHKVEKTVLCPFCAVFFQAPNNLKTHIYKHHREGF